MRRLLCSLLVAVLVASLMPSAAFAEGGDNVRPTDAALVDIANSYGHTDEGMTLGQLAANIGCSPKEAAALAGMADYWVTGGVPAARWQVGQIAGLAQAYAEYMRRNGHWDTFAERVNGMTDIGSDLLLNCGGLWDALGFDSLADTQAFPDVTTPSGTYYSGWAVSSHLPGLTERIRPSRGSLSELQYKNAIGLFYKPGYWLKLKSATYGGYGSHEYFSTVSGSGGEWLCANCGETGRFYVDNSVFVDWEGAAPGTFNSNLSFWGHQCATPPVSESAYMLKAVIDEGGLPMYLRFASMITDPNYALLSVVDTYGIPGYLPPGAIHDVMSDIGDWGEGLRAKAVKLANKAAGLPLGFEEIAEAFAELMKWFADFFTRAQAWVYALLLPNADYTRLEVPQVGEEMMNHLKERSVVGLMYGLADVLDALSSSQSPGGSDLMRVTLRFPGGSYEVNLSDRVDDLAPYRGYGVALLYLGFTFALVRWLRPRPKL